MVTIREYGSLLFAYIRPQWKQSLSMALTLFVGIALQLMVPQILRLFIDNARQGVVVDKLVYLALAFLAVSLINQGFSILVTYFSALVGWTATNKLREDLLQHTINLDMGFHNEKTPGEMIERIDGDVSHLSNFFSQFVVHIMGNALLCIGILGVLFMTQWQAGLILSIFALCAFLILIKTRNFAVKVAREQRELSGRFFGFLEEKLSALEDIRANGGGGYILNRFYNLNRQLFFKTRIAWSMRFLIWVFMMALFIVGDLLALSVGTYYFRDGLITLGTVFLFFHYTEMLRAPIEQITSQLQDFQNATASILRIDELLKVKQKIINGTEKNIPLDSYSIEFKDVHFSYFKGEPVLQNISFSLKKGETVGLLGRTGCGKTTVTRLLFRLYDIQRGDILLDGKSIKNYDIDTLRKSIGMVTQEVQLFHATVRDNLTFFDDTISDEKILNVIEELGLSRWFKKLPQGLDTMLSSKGKGLSAGEGQLLAFTRIFLQNPSVIVMDEPSSKLDPATESVLQKAIEKLIKGKTAIVIAHRLSTIENMDRIIILDNRTILEDGKREELAVDKNSRYYELLVKGVEKDIVV